MLPARQPLSIFFVGVGDDHQRHAERSPHVEVEDVLLTAFTLPFG